MLILASVLPANAFADSSVIHRQIHINPLYKDVVDQKQLFSTLNGAPRLYSDTQPQEAGSADEAAVILRKGMENREARIAIRCPADAITPTDGILDEIAEKAMEETGVPTQGDYIRWTYAGWREAIRWKVTTKDCTMSLYMIANIIQRLLRKPSCPKKSTAYCKVLTLTTSLPIMTSYVRFTIIFAQMSAMTTIT